MRHLLTNILLLGLCVSLVISEPAPGRRKKRIKTTPEPDTQIEPPEPETTEVTLLLLHKSPRHSQDLLGRVCAVVVYLDRDKFRKYFC